MEKTKTSKKALRRLIRSSVHDAIKSLELPTPNKRVKKIISKNAKRLAGEFNSLLKRERRKAKKSQPGIAFIEDVLTGKKKEKKESLQKENSLQSTGA